MQVGGNQSLETRWSAIGSISDKSKDNTYYSLCMIESHTTSETTLRQESQVGDSELVQLESTSVCDCDAGMGDDHTSFGIRCILRRHPAIEEYKYI